MIATKVVVGWLGTRSRGGMGTRWSMKEHIGMVDHRYGPDKATAWVATLCGRSGKIVQSKDFDLDELHESIFDSPYMCKLCAQYAQRLRAAI